MARKPREEGAGPGARCEVRAVEGARAFVTFGPEHAAWQGVGAIDSSVLAVPEGAFVRLEPPPDAEDALIAEVRVCVESQALRVVVLPRRRGAVVQAPREKRPHRKAREVVEELVAEANVEDRGALREFCEAVILH